MSNLTTRWTFEHVESGDIETFPFNPDTTSSREPAKQVEHSVSIVDGQARTFKAPPTPVEWTFSGPIRDQSHHEFLEAWSKRTGVVVLTDHLGRAYRVLISSYSPEDRQPTKLRPWRMKYSMKVMILRREL